MYAYKAGPECAERRGLVRRLQSCCGAWEEVWACGKREGEQKKGVIRIESVGVRCVADKHG